MHRRRHPPLRRDLPPEFFNTDHRMRIMVGTLVLNNHPTGISIEDLRYELRDDEDDDSVDRAIGAKGWRIVFLLRLSPLVPYALSNYFYGVTAIRFWPCSS